MLAQSMTETQIAEELVVPEVEAQAYRPYSQWRNRTEFFTGRRGLHRKLAGMNGDKEKGEQGNGPHLCMVCSLRKI